MTALIVWVLTENPAREFDKRLGDRRLAEKTVMMGKAEVREVAHGWAEAPPAPRSSGEAVRGLRVTPAYHPYPSRRPPRWRVRPASPAWPQNAPRGRGVYRPKGLTNR
jgi:hypothetical protein